MPETIKDNGNTINVIKTPCTTEIFESVDFNAITLLQAAENDAAQYVKYFRHCTLANVFVFCECDIIINIEFTVWQFDNMQSITILWYTKHRARTRTIAPNERKTKNQQKKLQFVNEKRNM